ncbi:diguanylate cyclase/phosphodiesterase [Ruminococcaceae bacterium KH2T8]|nr:diguanylate cyclase/phosphodiesterase [Ruminococcaceae bacterium KH2T8]
MVYRIEFDIAAVFVTLFMLYFIVFKKGLSKHANRVFLGMLVLNFVSEISDISASLTDNDPQYYPFFVQCFWNYVYILAHILTAYALVIYVFYLIGYEKSKRNALTAASVPVMIEILLLVTNPFHSLLFYFDAERRYCHGPVFGLLYMTALAYMIYSCYLAIRHRRGISIPKAKGLVFFMMISMIPIVIQIFFPYYLLSLFFEAIGLMGILFTIENKDDIINPTTGILNRFALQTALDRAMITGGHTLILFKIPNLNYYNKMIGFENMNGILNRISSWLEKMFSSYSVYDCGRGHFAALCDGISEEAVDKIRSESMARFEKPWGKGKFSLIFPVQFGVIHLPDDAKTVENLFMIIDAPFDGKLSTELDAGKVIADYERNVLVERLIDKALKNKSFEVYYQPIWNYTTGKVQSAEALCRLIDDEYGMIPPDEFIPVSERNGSILEIGKFVFDEVCRSYKEDRFKSLGIEYVEVNLSVVQCMSRDLKEEFDATLEKYSLDAECINLEITESATTQNRKILLDTIETLKSRGFTFSLDDYGTGYSNITYMYEMPFSIIKIDKSILWKAMDPVTGEGQRNAVIYLENTVRMLKDMDYHILVEGVETLEQKMFLEKLEVDYLQGYYFSKPVRKQVFTDYLKVVNA